MLAGDFLGQFEREAVCVVEAERDLARHLRRAALLQCRYLAVEQLQARRQRLAELALLDAEHFNDTVATLRQFGVVPLEEVNHRVGGLRQERPLQAEQPPMPHGAAQHPPEDVAASLVARQHAIRREEDERAPMIGDHAQRLVMFRILAVLGPDQRGELIDDWTEEIGVVDRLHPLKYCRQPLQPHAGVDVGLLERRARPVGILEILHEDEIPDLQEAVAALAARRAVGVPAATLYATVKVDLRVRPAGTRRSRRPPPVVFKTRQALGGDAGDLVPVARRFGVVGMDGGIEPLGGQAIALGE